MSSITDNGLTGSFTPSPQNSSKSVGTYTTGNYYLDNTITWGIDRGNGTGGFQGILLVWGEVYGPFSFKMVFDNPIPKDNTQVFNLTMRFSWARA
jgi:hypothetical protein